MSIRLKLSLLLILLFTSSIGNVVFTYELESYWEEKLKWVNHEHEIIHVSESFLSRMMDAETGQRGFLLTGNVDYLEPYYSGSVDAKIILNELVTLTKDNFLQQQRLVIVETLTKQKLQVLEQTVDLMQNGNKLEALAIWNKNSNKKIMDDIKEEITKFSHEERVLLEQREGDFRESRARITTLVIIEFIVFVFMGVITAVFIKGRLFNPLKQLMMSTSKMENGEKQDISELLPKDEMGYLLSRFYKMSEKVIEKNETLSYNATHDELTGLRNRADIHNEINNAIMYLENTNRKIAIIFIDLNNFKQLNDTLGHDTGDFVLKETSERLLGTVRASDVVFRYGGDEFVIVIKRFDEISQIEAIVSNTLREFETAVSFRGHTIDISLSMGIAISPDDSINSDEIIRYADIAMYNAKRDKDTHHKFFDRSMIKHLDGAKSKFS